LHLICEYLSYRSNLISREFSRVLAHPVGTNHVFMKSLVIFSHLYRTSDIIIYNIRKINFFSGGVAESN